MLVPFASQREGPPKLYKCRWCQKNVAGQQSSNSNLKTHRDGSNIKGLIRPACPGRGKAISQGAKLPETAAEAAAAAEPSAQGSTKTLTNFLTKSKFDNDTFNKILVLWIIRHSLPWVRINDYLLKVVFDYANQNTKVLSRTWASQKAHLLYLGLKNRVMSDIKVSLMAKIQHGFSR
jgi:hypothetical protein